VRVDRSWDGAHCDLLVALHARRSHDSIHRFARRHPDRPCVVALTGTDVYFDLGRSPRARRSLRLATRIVVLQPLALRRLPAATRRRARVIFQSVARPPGASAEGNSRRPSVRAAPGGAGAFDACVLAHLRPVKDPLRAARAARLLPAASRLRVVHAGRAHTRAMEERARAEVHRNPRYRWLGDLPRRRALALLSRCRLLVVSSRMEGGANVVSEAIAAGVPILASRIPGNVGLLGRRYPGYFRAGDTRALARILRRAEQEPRFLKRLGRAARRLARLVQPGRERAAWAALLREISGRRVQRRGRGR
jgi:putative glycosyltransferase (TIGR04348 family)